MGTLWGERAGVVIEGHDKGNRTTFVLASWYFADIQGMTDDVTNHDRLSYLYPTVIIKPAHRSTAALSTRWVVGIFRCGRQAGSAQSPRDRYLGQ